MTFRRYLGYDEGIAQNESAYGIISRKEKWALNDIRCRGTELSLGGCEHSSSQDCLRGSAASVFCSGTKTASTSRPVLKQGDTKYDTYNIGSRQS